MKRLASVNHLGRQQDTGRRFIPALRFDFLTPLYDLVVAATTREKHFKSTLLSQANMEPGECVLDVGCGTGTLLRDAARSNRSTNFIGIDADESALEIARGKIASTADTCQLVRAFANQIPFVDCAFDQALTTLFFHHLDDAGKRQVATELFRVLRPGGQLNVADWGRPTGHLQRLVFYIVQWLDGFANTAANVEGELPGYFERAGFIDIVETQALRTPLGTIRLLQGSKP